MPRHDVSRRGSSGSERQRTAFQVFDSRRGVVRANEIVRRETEITVAEDQWYRTRRHVGHCKCHAAYSRRELSLPIDAVVRFNSVNVAVSPTNVNRFLAAINSVVYRSEDAGNTWNTFSLGLSSHMITELLINASNASKVLVITRPVGA